MIKSLERQKLQALNKEKIKTGTKCLRRQFRHHTGTTWWAQVTFPCGVSREIDKYQCPQPRSFDSECSPPFSDSTFASCQEFKNTIGDGGSTAL